MYGVRIVEISMLLATESKEEFAKMRDEFFEDLQPEGAIERRYSEDVVSLTWEILRYRRAKAGIINAALLSALHVSVGRCVWYRAPNYSLKVESLARGWFENGEAKAEVVKLLETFGFDETTIAAEAFRLCAENIERCDRMEALAEARREKALRFIGELKGELGARLRQSSDRILKKEEIPSLIPVTEESD
jgi:hypothetical protein